jgi:hypothetical protein
MTFKIKAEYIPEQLFCVMILWHRMARVSGKMVQLLWEVLGSNIGRITGYFEVSNVSLRPTQMLCLINVQYTVKS